MPLNTMSVTRPGDFGNPFKAIEAVDGNEKAVATFEKWLSGDHAVNRYEDQRLVLLKRLPELRGRNLACFCALDKPCHADVLLKLANG